MPPSEPIDPRLFGVAERLRNVGRVIAITGSKGGIGKTAVASLLALASSDRGARVGLLDLDFTSPTAHVVLGIERAVPSETFGIDPIDAHGIATMSVAFVAGDRPAPMRGEAETNALIELLAITEWGALDVLVLDMPPGLGDMTLDVIRYLPQAEFVLVASSARMVIGSVRRALALLSELDAPILGILENMQRDTATAARALADEFAVPYLGSVPFDEGLESALGDAARLRTTDAYRAIHEIAPSFTG